MRFGAALVAVVVARCRRFNLVAATPAREHGSVHVRWEGATPCAALGDAVKRLQPRVWLGSPCWTMATRRHAPADSSRGAAARHSPLRAPSTRSCGPRAAVAYGALGRLARSNALCHRLGLDLGGPRSYSDGPGVLRRRHGGAGCGSMRGGAAGEAGTRSRTRPGTRRCVTRGCVPRYYRALEDEGRARAPCYGPGAEATARFYFAVPLAQTPSDWFTLDCSGFGFRTGRCSCSHPRCGRAPARAPPGRASILVHAVALVAPVLGHGMVGSQAAGVRRK